MAPTGNYKRNQRQHRGVSNADGCCSIHWLAWILVSSFAICGWQTVVVATAFSSSALAFVTTKGCPRFRFDLTCGPRPRDIHILSTPGAASLTKESKQSITACLVNAGIWKSQSLDLDDGHGSSRSPIPSQSSEGLLLLARDFVDRPEVFSSLLVTDFGFPMLEAHQTRALVMAAIREEREDDETATATAPLDKTPQNNSSNRRDDEETTGTLTTKERTVGISKDDLQNNSVGVDNNANNGANGAVDGDRETLSTDDGGTVEARTDVDTKTKTKTYSMKEQRSSLVNERAKRRKRSVEDHNYGLPKDYATLYPKLALELDDFYIFMTQPSTYSQESPIRDATAKVYMTHAKLFLGWCCQNIKTGDSDGDTNEENMTQHNDAMSIFAVLPNKEKESAENIIRFVLWIRTRDISVSYEANLLRGITKLLKFRFAKESNSDPLDGKNTFDDIPVIKEVRKLHRDANQRQRLAPRSSDESKKWITWQDYLGVAQNTKNEVVELIRKYEGLPPAKRKYPRGDTDREHSLEQIRVAEAYQRYLILAILASIPDRQRTIRELEVGRTLIKDTDRGCWVVKHGPGDYKTGKHYGERPAMQLAEELTPAIDDFLERWRPSLKPSTNALLVQKKTGKPMTSNSVFKRVVRCCFKYTGKSVNPHLLRDIIVTHVRETEASEKELEALALYMGHSIQMQRSSYDRRTLSTKVAPAVQLMKSMNKIDGCN